MLKMQLEIPGGLWIEIEKANQKELIEEASFWQSIPQVCPVDGSKTRLFFKEPGDFKYYGVTSTGDVRYELSFGQHREGGTLFVKDEWTHWDGEAAVVVWKAGKQLCPPGNSNSTAATSRAPSPGGQLPPAQLTNQDVWSAPPLDQDPLSTLRLEINNLGLSLAGNKAAAWEAKRAVHVNRVTKNRTPKIEQMNEKELKELLLFLQGAAAKVPVVGK
jgi:hypothetical protein